MSLQGNIQLDNGPDFGSFSPESYKNASGTKKMDPTNSSTEHMIFGGNESDVNDSAAPAPTGCCSFCSFEYYEPYFNVSQQEIVSRVTRSLTPWKQNFFENISQKPDLYGPFWILTTIVFLLSLMGNLTTYLGNYNEQRFKFRLELVRIGAIVVYSFGIGFPMALGLLLRFFKAKVTPFNVVCLYGYSLSCFIPILVLCVIPHNLWQWVLMIYGILNSTVFLIMNINSEIRSLAPQKQYIIYGLLAACQISLFLTFKVVFFKTVYSGSSPDVSSSETDGD